MPFHLFNVDLGGEGQLKAAQLIAENIRKDREKREQTEKEIAFSDTLMKSAHVDGRVSDEEYTDYLKKPANAKHSAAVAQMANIADDYKQKQLAARVLQFSQKNANQNWSPDPGTVKRLEAMGIVAAPTSPHSVQYMDTRKRGDQDEWTRLDRDARAITGAGLGEWAKAKNHRIEDGKMVAEIEGVEPPKGMDPTVARLAGLAKPAKKLVAPVAEYQALIGRYQALSQGDGAAPAGRTAPAEVGGAPELSPVDQQALEWATAHPADPRAAQIRKRLGLDGGGLDADAGAVEPDNLQ